MNKVALCKELAELCMNATKASRDSDCRIWCALTDQDYNVYREALPDLSIWVAHLYTSNYKDAMSIVPEGYHTHMAMQDRHTRRWKWVFRGGLGFTAEARGETEYLAISAAALLLQQFVI